MEQLSIAVWSSMFTPTLIECLILLISYGNTKIADVDVNSRLILELEDHEFKDLITFISKAILVIIRLCPISGNKITWYF